MIRHPLSAIALSAFLISSIAGTEAQAAGGKAHWGYDGAEGPDNWASLSSDYGACAGTSQSPIDIETGAAIKAGYPAATLGWTGFTPEVLNNGHTIQVNTGGKGGSLTAGGKTYNLLQFHFHHLSEHTINGKHAPMEVHFVHQSAEGDLFVVGVMIREGQPNPVLDAIWPLIPKAGNTAAGSVEIDPADLMSDRRAAYRYKGSLTTPPCSEIVTWHVMAGAVTASKDQIAAFKALYPNNYRPIQPGNRRFVLTSQ